MNDLQALVRAILHTNVPQVRAIIQATPEVLLRTTSNHQYPIELAKDKGHKAIETAIARQLDVTQFYSGKELQRLLVDYLAEVSEHYFCAGWRDSLEFEVWAVVQQDSVASANPRFWNAPLDPEQLADLTFLANKTGCWATWSDAAVDSPQAGVRVVPLPHWEAIYRTWQDAQFLTP
ncbi:hypothetical protein SAMN00120144_3979 [Hymenobacter roseosalivarius DSM 11622]|uniref:Uncharacterized protein n=2 Tax=Hymenobacter roseosalivarius TaxID=89967 RepID=A0A1W1UF78_9BACT|nr:hypothetical protein SAMN00120144_3979 [Hymenobacter roseosalivarius DSM 11622]